MSCGALRRLLASFAAALSLAAGVADVHAGNGCGCEAPPPCQTVVRYRHHCHHSPPVGMVVPSMPVMPMMAMPMMMAPAMPVAAAPMAVAPLAAAPVAAPAPTYQLTVAAPAAAAAPTCMTQDQLVRALSAALAKEGSGVGAVSPNMTTEERLADLERRVSKLESQTRALEGNTKDIVDILKAMKQKMDN